MPQEYSRREVLRSVTVLAAAAVPGCSDLLAQSVRKGEERLNITDTEIQKLV